jgi:adenine phosphoribosyltransferase
MITMDAVKAAIRDIPDFPKQGILFKDITPILQDATLFRSVVDALTERYRGATVDKVLAMESRGFIFAAPLAAAIGAGFVPLRKLGKLPYRTVSETFDLEYGTETLEVHEDAVSPGERVVVVDDLLATGGTARAAVDLTRRLGGELVELAFVVELCFLGGRERLAGYPIFSLIEFD